ncbi:tetracycline-efflux transporter-like protein [Phyllosticta citribraziliensis]|uniref:Tetracycline-efflux transporter-like protein n=1 Tax=Phyllosticta citribraziliensis TaxID=989973 RepID=A0ABR1LU21_9PEZI
MTVESEPVFEADAAADIAVRARRNAAPDGLHDGHDMVVSAVGGFDTQRRDDERAPLLPKVDDDDRPPPYSEFAALPWYRRPSVYWMLPMFFITALANAGIIVPKMNLIISLICRRYFADEAISNPMLANLPLDVGTGNPQCHSADVSAQVAQFTLYGNLMSGILCAITSPKLGALSDRYGRLRIIVITSTGMLIGDAIILCAANFPEKFPVNWILAAYAVEGLCGSFIAAMAIAHSYATDCIPVDRRSTVFGYFHAALFTGVALGPIVSAYIIRAMGSIVSIFYISIGVHVAFILLTGLCVPESLTKARQAAAREKHALERAAIPPSSDWIDQIRNFNLFEPLKVLYPKGRGTSPALRRNLLLLAAVDTTVFGVHMGAVNVAIIYTSHTFNWTNFETSRLVSISNGSRVFFLMIVLPLINRVFRGRARDREASARNNQPPAGADAVDLGIIRTAIFFDTLGYLGYTLSRSSNSFLISSAVAAAGGIGSPTLQSSLTKHVPPDRTGQLLGAIGLLHALARVVAPTVFNAIYAATVASFAQAVWIALTAVFAVAWAASFFVRPGLRLGGDDEDQSGGDAEAEAARRASESERNAAVAEHD